MPLAVRVLPRPFAAIAAPALGWAVHSALALPIFFIIGMSRAAVVAVFALSCLAALIVMRRDRSPPHGVRLTVASIVALIAAMVLALCIMAAVLPKFTADGVALASPIFDHSKIAMVDEMARMGVPPINPFFAGPGPARLSYYYLWHFSAAELSVLAQVSGWEADAGLTWFTAFASLALMIGLAVGLSGKPAAALWVAILAASASLRPVLYALIPEDRADMVAGYPSGFGGWLFQTSWAPQHMASATCAVLAIVLLVEVMQRPRLVTLLTFALTMAAGFESSTWVGGVVFPLAAAPVTVLMLYRAEPAQRFRAVLYAAGAAFLAVLLISPFLYEQVQMAVLRGGGSPIIFEPYEILDDKITDVTGDLADIPAYWLVYLVVELPAIYVTGIVSMAAMLKDRAMDGERRLLLPFAFATAVSLGAGGMLVSTLGENNDLGWRAVLPAILLLVAFAAAGLSRLDDKPFRPAMLVALGLILLGLPDAAKLIANNVYASSATPSKAFAAAPELWRAVRRVAAPDERVANNPLATASITPWPANTSWALLANRRSCYAGEAFAPLMTLSSEQGGRISERFIRVFGGAAQPGDVDDLATRYHCRVAVVTPLDGAWSSDPFAASPQYRVVESTATWRIYRAVAP